MNKRCEIWGQEIRLIGDPNKSRFHGKYDSAWVRIPVMGVSVLIGLERSGPSSNDRPREVPLQ